MNRQLALIVLVLVAAAAMGWRRQESLKQIRFEIEARRLALARTQLQSSTPSASLTESEIAEIRRLREQHRELMKLRGSIQELRKRAKQDPSQIAKEAGAKRREADLFEGWLKHEDESKIVAEALNMAIAFSVEASRLGKRPLSASFAEAESILSTMAQTNSHPAQMFLQWYNSTNTIRFAALEMIPQPSPVHIRDRDPNQDFIIIREKQPRQTPDGKWTRYYGWLQGNIEQVTLPSLAFDAWENNQKAVR